MQGSTAKIYISCQWENGSQMDIFSRLNLSAMQSPYSGLFIIIIGSSADNRNVRKSKDSETSDQTIIYLQKLL